MPLPAEFQSAKILIVDDQTANVLFLEQMLSTEGYASIIATTDSRKVEPLCRANRFDLILLDLDMPHLNGFEVMARLKEIEPESYLPILVLTAMTDQQTRLRALASGAKDFILKHPFDHLETMTRIRNMLEVRLAHNLVRDQNRLLEEKVRERTRELQNTRLEIIHRLGRAIEYHDNDT
ncbi:MAG: response regulator, partial [Sulfuricella sp.]|nr:response regulator [Sulfuricella sp.]